MAVTGPQYQVWTLSYTRKGLIAIFCWLLWGDLVWRLMEMVFQPTMQFQLDRLHIPKKWEWLAHCHVPGGDQYYYYGADHQFPLLTGRERDLAGAFLISWQLSFR